MNPFVRFAVPPGVVSDTVFAPAVLAGVTAVTVVEFTTDTLVAAAPPIVTELVPVRFVPVIVIAVPPAVGPTFGLTDEIVGGAKYVKPLVSVPWPQGEVTTTFFAPAVPAGVVTVMVLVLTTTIFVAATPPIVTLVAPVKSLPEIVTAVPPAIGPTFGVMLETVGGGYTTAV